MPQHWFSHNHVELLENGEQFYPRVLDAIRAARQEVIVETFIVWEDKVGIALADALCEAARRGAEVDLLVDGFGSADLSEAYIGRLVEAGVRLRVFDPGRRILGQRLNLLRRMHRKIAVVDGELAFVGGINYCADQLMDFGPEAKQDYAVAIAGPVVPQIRRFALQAMALGDPKAHWLPARLRQLARSTPAGGADVQFVSRDNHRHPDDIERHYLAAIRAARRRIVIANAYFFPGYRLIKALRRAARRGVEVDLILQGTPDMPIVKVGATMLYHHLLHAGVRIHEYCQRPLHGKVAVVDGRWSTVGSSNLDPLSLSLNLEANVIVRSTSFAQALQARLEELMRQHCQQIDVDDLDEWSAWRLVRSFFVFHLLRWYPAWATWLPRHAPRLEPVSIQATGAANGADHA